MIQDGIVKYVGYYNWMIKSLRKAYNQNADIISNSWSFNNYSLTIFNSIIDSITTLGRNGKGCVVIFSTGNDSTNIINYPASLNNTIAVGASNRYGNREPFSNYGSNLDVVAPGKDVYTTQIIPYGSYCYSTGTSMACPMVAGVAALILSVNPYLHWQDVRSIIRQTAYKLPDYTFNTITPDGTWNNEVGYGLVDANAAVVCAGTKWIQNKTYANGNHTIQNGVNLLAGYAVTNNQTYGNVVALPGSTVRYKATNQIVLEPGFIAAEGSNFIAQIVDVYNSPLFTKRHIEYEADDDIENTISDSDNIIEFQNNNINLFYNSDNKHLTIQSQQAIQSIRIYNITGQCVMQTRQTDIDTSNLPAGVYIITANTTTGETLQNKFINY